MRIMMRDEYPTTDPIANNQEAIDAINALFEMNGYRESQGDLWLGHTLDRLKEFLGDPHPFASIKPKPCEHINVDFYFERCDDCGADLSDQLPETEE